MKTTLNIVILINWALLLGCGQTATRNEKPNMEKDSISSTRTENKRNEEDQQRLREEENRKDSLRLDIALKDAFKIAQTSFKTGSFIKRYEIQPDDDSYKIDIEILIGKLFQDNQKYFLLRRHVPWATYLNLYKINNGKAEKLIEHEQSGMTYIRDTIFDVNGDGYRDFLVHWYPSSGCCVRNVYNVYLNQPGPGMFTRNYEFINPTFSAKEKIIRGVEYGHPGEVGLYKYKWNGSKVDTIEFIYPDGSVKGQFIKTHKEASMPTEKEGIVLKTIPKEYHIIQSYDWFIGF